jgi:hypothetical protein
MHSEISTRALAVATCLGLLNFFTFMVVSSLIGGDAANGYVEHGHYYLRDHARITEVPKAVFEYSRWHARSLWLTHPIAGFASMMWIGRSMAWWRKQLGQDK